MADQFTERVKNNRSQSQGGITGYFNRLGSAISGMIFGLLLFCISFYVVWTTEGMENLASVAQNATTIQVTSPYDPKHNGQLVNAYGPLTTNQTIGDGLYLEDDYYLVLKRKIEMYAWQEEKQSTDQGEETEVTYTYTKHWTSNPADSSRFRIIEDHYNPAPAFNSQTWHNPQVQMGTFQLRMEKIDYPHDRLQTLNLSDKILTRTTNQPTQPEVSVNTDNQSTVDQSTSESIDGFQPLVQIINNGQELYLPFTKDSQFSNPQVGDIRISYQALLPEQSLTILAEQQNDSLLPYVTDDDQTLYRLFDGTYAQAQKTLQSEHSQSVWMWRAIGFFMMWTGLMLLLGPLRALVSFIPLINSLTNTLIGLITFFVALILTGITIILAKVFYTTLAWLLPLTIIAVVGGIIFLLSKNPRFSQNLLKRGK